MLRMAIALLTSSGLLLAASPTNAQTFRATLTPFDEQPTPQPFGPGATAIGPAAGQLKLFTQGPGLEGGERPVSSGFAQFTLDTAVPVLNMTVTVFDIDVTGSQTPFPNDNLVAAHIHAGPTAIPGVSAAPVVWGFFGLPFNDTDMDVMLTPLASGVGGTFTGQWDATEGNNTTLALQIPNILAGLSYINFHTTQFQGGEIRGQILQVPEPTTLALLGAGLVVFMGFDRLRRRRKF